MSAKLEPGDKVKLNFGPYTLHARVTEVTDRGAVVALPTVAVLDHSLTHDIIAPDGTVLAKAPFGFLGRAHWAGARIGGDR